MTSSRRAEADRLGALGITSDPTELVQMLQALAVRKPEAAPVQPASTVKVFLEYRRDDARAYAGRLADRLRSHFGSDAVFMDIEAIQLGVDFVESLVQALESSHVVLALIGPNWLSASDSQGRRRLDDPDDIVRVALRAAFERNIRVIPVLVDGASIPRQDELPADIAQLARINAIALDDARWDYDVERLIEAVERLGMMSVAQPTASANPPNTPGAPTNFCHARARRESSWRPLLLRRRPGEVAGNASASRASTPAGHQGRRRWLIAVVAGSGPFPAAPYTVSDRHGV